MKAMQQDLRRDTELFFRHADLGPSDIVFHDSGKNVIFERDMLALAPRGSFVFVAVADKRLVPFTQPGFC